MESLAGDPVPAPFSRGFKKNETTSSFGRGKKILRSLHRLAQAAQELLQILVALDEIDLRGVHDEQIRSRVAEKEMLVRVGDRFEIFRRYLLLRGIAFFRYALSQHLRLGVQINHQIGRGNDGASMSKYFS